MIKKTRKIISIGIAIVSALLCIAVAYLWFLSKDSWYNCGYGNVNTTTGRSHFYYISTIDDGIIISDVTEEFADPRDTTTTLQGFHQGWESGQSRLWTFGMGSLGQLGEYGRVTFGIGWLWKDSIPYSGYMENSRLLLIPFWLALALSAICPVYSTSICCWRKFRHHKAVGKCPTCSYDLRAHSPGQLCPECGTPIQPTTQSKS